MSTPFENDVWHEPEQLPSTPREICAEPMRLVIQAAFADYVQPTDHVVEIGSGTGLLEEILDRNGPTTFVEGSQTMLDAHRAKRLEQKREGGALVQADLYRLPFADNSVDAVTGLLVLDAMIEMPTAFDEITRILKPGGKFVYFHDARASGNAIASAFRETGNVPVPVTFKGDYVDALALIPADKFGGFEDLIRQEWPTSLADHIISILRNEADNPHIDFWQGDPQNVARLTELVHKSRDAHITPAMSLTFSHLLETLAQSNSMEIEENGLRYDQVIVDRQDVHPGFDLPSDVNFLAQSVEDMRFGFDKDLPKDKIILASEPLVFVATKL